MKHPFEEIKGLDLLMQRVLDENPQVTKEVTEKLQEELQMSLDMNNWQNRFNVCRRISARILNGVEE